MVCPCGPEWLVEAFDLVTGRVLGTLPAISLDVQVQLNKPATGTLNLSARDVPPRLVWPRLVGVGVMWQGAPVWVGYVDAVEMGSDSTLRVGLESLDKYPFHRHLDVTVQWNNTDQNRGLASLVNVHASGIALSATWEASTVTRNRRWPWWDHKIIGDIMTNMSQSWNGPDWELIPERSNGFWSGTIAFRDTLGVERSFSLVSNRDSGNYGITIDAQDMGTHQHAVGDGQEDEQVEAYAEDLSVYPRFDVTTGYSSVTSVETLQDQARGRIEMFSEPAAIPSMVIDGPDPTPDMLQVGDVANVDIDHAQWRYQGAARVIGLTYRAGPDKDDERSVMFAPLQRPSDTILRQVATDECEDC